MQYRCPVDDRVFETQLENRMPTLEGHPECDGPSCREKFAGRHGRTERVSPITSAAISKPSPVNADAASGVLDKPPLGQGW
jgi:hypothetical protein